MPHEEAVRAWLARARVAPEDIEDMIQEAYCSLAGLESVDHIERPDGYFFSIVRNLHLRRVARARVVPLVPLVDIGEIVDDTASPEQEAAARRDYDRMAGMIAGLPERRRRIFELRKVEGKSQREIAALLGLSENVVEHEIRKGMAEILQRWRSALREGAERLARFDSAREHRA